MRISWSADRYRKAHHSYHSNGVTDLAVMRDQAQKRAFDKVRQEDTVIHLHPYDENGNNCGVENTHEYYEAREGLIK